MYPKNKPLPPEAARRISHLNTRSEADKAIDESPILAAVSTKPNCSRGVFGRAEHDSAPSPPLQPKQSSTMKKKLQAAHSNVLPPSYVDSVMTTNVLEDASFPETPCNSGVMAAISAENALRTTTQRPFSKESVLPPPYGEFVSNTTGLVGDVSYNAPCTVGAPPPPPPPKRHSQTMQSAAPATTAGGRGSVCMDGAYAQGWQMNAFPPPSMVPRPFAWPTPTGTTSALTQDPPSYIEAKGYPPSVMPCFSNSGSSVASPNTMGRVWRNGLHHRKESPGRGADEIQSSPIGGKGNEADNINEFSHTRQPTALSNVSTQQQQQQQEEQEQSMASWVEKAKHISQQHSCDVTFLMRVIMVLLERLTLLKASKCVGNPDNSSGVMKHRESCGSGEKCATPTEVPQKDDDNGDEEAHVLKEQLSELEDVLYKLQTDQIKMKSSRGQLLAGIMTLPSLLPISAGVCMAMEEPTTPPSLDVESLELEKELLARSMAAEVKTLMKAIDFETTRPLTLNVVATSSGLNSSWIASASAAAAAVPEGGG